MGLDEELRDLFLKETTAHQKAAGETLQSMREGRTEGLDLSVMMRGFHTLAGSAGLLGLRALGELAGASERVVRRWKNPREALVSEIDLLEEVVRAVGVFLSTGKEPASDPLLNRFRALFQDPPRPPN